MSGFMTAEARAEIIWELIGVNPFSVTLKRNGVMQAAQTVRMEYDKQARDAVSAAGQGSVRALMLFGVRDHPTVPDTDIKKGDRFVYKEREYTLLDPIYPLPGGEVQCRAEAVG
jgi:hypothetical protein